MSIERLNNPHETGPPSADPNIFSALIPDDMAFQVERLNTTIHQLANGRHIDERGKSWPQLKRSFGDIELLARASGNGEVILRQRSHQKGCETEIEELTFNQAIPSNRIRKEEPMSVSWVGSKSAMYRLKAEQLKKSYSRAVDPNLRQEIGGTGWDVIIDGIIDSSQEHTLERAELLLASFEHYFPDSRLKRTGRIIGGLIDRSRQ